MDAYLNLLRFAGVYSMAKCLKTMMVGNVCMCMVLLLRKYRRNADRDLCMVLLLFPAALTGMSKLFYQRGTFRATMFLYEHVQPIYGEIYFAVCNILLLRWLWQHLRMRHYLKSLEIVEDRALLQEGIACVTGMETWFDSIPDRFVRRNSTRFSLRRWYLSRTVVYITKENISPFSGGILRPYVVIPERIYRDWHPTKLRLVFCHELIHIRSGHMLWLAMFRLLGIYWWINPVFHYCFRLMRKDMEMVCDELCAAYTGASAADYGRTMLDMAEFMHGKRMEGSMAFLRFDGNGGVFEEMKSRLAHLMKMRGGRETLRRHKYRIWGTTVAMVALIATVMLTSYPIYTKMTELVLYDEHLNMVDYDSAALRQAVQVQNGELVIEEELFGQLLADNGIEDEYVYVAFDGIMKEPGCGGGGNSGMISTKDYGDIFYLSADCIENDIMIFCLKYLL